MKVSDQGKQFVLDWETGGGVPGKGYMKLEPWPDPPGSGRYSIGAGYNFDPNVEPDLMEGVTEEQAWQLFYDRAAQKEKALNTIFQDVELSQNQFDALFSFAWNLGANPAFTLFKWIKEGRPEREIREKWKEYRNFRDNGVMVPSEYLRRRRIAEANMFFSYPGTSVPETQIAGLGNIPDWVIYVLLVGVLIFVMYKIFKN